MLLWLMFAAMTAMVLVAVLRPAFRQPFVSSSEPAADLAVYRDQLADLEKQVARGQLDTNEHEALRHEISRRILRLKPTNTRETATGIKAATVGMAAAVGVPLLCLALYAQLGSPNVPSRPFRADPAQLANASAAELIARVEARLVTNPDDGRGWDAIAPIYFKLERFADASEAYGRAVRLLGESPQRLAGFAEATVLANDGIVTEQARVAYQKLRVASPDRFEPRFWLALAQEQDGNKAVAAAEYRALLQAAPADISWRGMVEQRLAVVTKNAASAKGPSDDDIKAAALLSEVDRTAMIIGMVDALAVRLKSNSADLDGWQKLIRSYVILKKPDLARAALTDARAKFVGNLSAITTLDDLARRLELRP
jgi:cytochrome c-type biogenesis protein CcmH